MIRKIADVRSIAPLGRGNRSLREHNERLVLRLLRSHGELSKSELCSLTGLAAQTLTTIMDRLESDDMVLRGRPIRGSVGQPAVPFRLNENGSFAIGLKVGRRSLELGLVDAFGQIRKRSQLFSKHFFTAQYVTEFVAAELIQLRSSQPDWLMKRLCGIGIAAPSHVWEWKDTMLGLDDTLNTWKNFDLTEKIAGLSEWPVYNYNDGTAACSAELMFGEGKSESFIYFYVGFFVGGGIARDGEIVIGKSGNAGAFGSCLVPGRTAGSEQLITSASLYALELLINRSGVDGERILRNPDMWDCSEDLLNSWIREAARGIAVTSVNAAAILDCSTVLVDGAIPADVRTRLVEAVREAMRHIDTSGLDLIEVREGSVGCEARMLGAASRPLWEKYGLSGLGNV